MLLPVKWRNFFTLGLDPNYATDEVAKGLPASPGAVSGVIALSADEAVRLKEKNINCILVRQETSPRRYFRNGCLCRNFNGPRRDDISRSS